MSDGFSADWLALREPYDSRARAPALQAALASWCGRRRSVKVIDLGAGTGANLRHLAPALPSAQDWTLVERDPALIEAGSARLAAQPTHWRYRALDLATNLEQLADLRPDLITASALLDLVSADWLARLLQLARGAGAALFVVLSYMGEIEWIPGDRGDRDVTALVNCHHRSDKGFGPALGPAATDSLRRLHDAAHVEPRILRSDWVLEPDDREIQKTLLDGYLTCVASLAGDAERDVRSWASRRLALIEGGRSHLRVGHDDVLILPP